MALEFLPALSGPLLERVLDDTYPLWGEGLRREDYGRWNHAQSATPWGVRHLRRVGLLDDGRPVASAKWYALEAEVNGEPVAVLGIGAVFTVPDRRGEGLAAELIRRLCDHAAAAGARLALLFSEIGAEFYERLGFTVVPRALVNVDVKPFRGGPPAALMRTVDARDMASIAAMSAGRLASTSFALVRSAEFVAFTIARKRLLAGLAPMGARHVEVLVTEEAYDAVACVVVTHGPHGAVLESCGDRDPDGARVGAMLQAMVARAPAEPRLRLAASLPRGFRPPQLELHDAGAAPELMMVRGIGGSPTPNIDPARVVYWPLDVF